jgi:hypothetical protein
MKLLELIENDTSTIAKKEEKCAGCGKMIKVGEKKGTFHDNPMHKECFMKRFRELGSSSKVGIQAPEGWKEMLKGSPVDPTPFLKKKK